MKELNEFIKISRYIGERFDLIQAGGGNVSVKNDNNMMIIKASGVELCEVTPNYGYTKINYIDLLNFISDKQITGYSRNQDKVYTKIINKCNLMEKIRPSVEASLHTLFKKYTIHTHPILVNAICCRKNWENIISKIDYSPYKFLCISYKTPGLELALEIKKQIKDIIPDIVFLQNHGLIVTSDDFSEIFKIQEFVLSRLENYLNVDFSDYKLTNYISLNLSKYFNDDIVTILSCDSLLNNTLKENEKLFYTKPFCPDMLVYGGIIPLKIKKDFDIELLQYKEIYKKYPRIIIYDNKIFFVAQNIYKAKQIQDVFKFHIMSLMLDLGEINYLSDDEIKYLDNWEIEKFRQKIGEKS